MAQASHCSDGVSSNASPLAAGGNATPLATIVVTAQGQGEERESDAEPLADGAMQHAVTKPYTIRFSDLRDQSLKIRPVYIWGLLK